MDKCKISIYFGLIISIIIIFNIKTLSFLDKVVICKPKVTLWAITHFICYFIVGKLCPNNFKLFLYLGIIWEVFEKIYGYITNSENYWTSGGYNGQIKDIGFNMLGYYLAHKL